MDLPQTPELPKIPEVQLLPPKKPSYARWWVIGSLAFIVIAWMGLYFLIPRGIVVIGDQFPGRAVHVKRLVLTRPGWIALRKVSAIDGIQEIGNSLFLEPEDYREFDISIHEDAEDLVSADKLSGTLYEDTNGDDILDFNVDKPMKTILGWPVRASFVVQ